MKHQPNFALRILVCGSVIYYICYLLLLFLYLIVFKGIECSNLLILSESNATFLKLAEN